MAVAEPLVVTPGVGTTHHIKLGDKYFLLRQGTYRKRPAPLFGSRFSTGDPDYNNLSFWQHWVQSCWIGGFGADTWRDDAMFDEGVGIDSTQHEVLLLSRDLTRPPLSTMNTGSSPAEKYPREFHEFNDDLYCVTLAPPGERSRVWRYTRDWATGWEMIHYFGDRVRAAAVFSRHLVFADGGSQLSKMTPSHVFSSFNKPGGTSGFIPAAMMTYRGRLYMSFDNEIWRLKPDFTWDGSTAFYTSDAANYITDMERHLGFLYMASRNGHVLRTDGNNTFDIWQFDPGIQVVSIRSFDGRLFISTVEPLEGTTAQQTVLYQFTGAAVTELKRWGEEGSDIQTGKLRVYRNRLFFGAGSMLGMGKGFGVAAYDPREDSYHMWATNRDDTTWSRGTEGVNWIVDDCVIWNSWLYTSVRGHGIFRTKSSYKDAERYLASYDATPGPGRSQPKGNGWYTSSDFDAGTPGLLKLFNAVTVHVDLPTNACSVLIEYSKDGGAHWLLPGGTLEESTVGGVDHPLEVGRVRKVIKFGDGGVRAPRLKLRVNIASTENTHSPALRGLAVRYLPLPEPGWTWEFDIVVSDDQELLDGSRDHPDVKALSEYLDQIYRDQGLLNFIDIDGHEWTTGGGKGVLFYQFEKQVPFSGPGSDGDIEAIYRCTLLEAVEKY